MRGFTNNERIILDFLIKNKGKWFTPTIIARKADKREHCCSWASHVCLRLSKFEILKHNTAGGYCYKGEGESHMGFYTPEEYAQLHYAKVNKNIIRPLRPQNTEVDLKCLNGVSYTISTLFNGLQVKKNSDNDKNLSISTCKGDRIIIEDDTVYIN